METQHSYCVPRVCAPKKHDHEQQCVRNSMCPRLPGPLDRMRSEKPRIKRERKNCLILLSQALSILPSCLVIPLSYRDGWNLSVVATESQSKMDVVKPKTKVATPANHADNPL